MKQRQALRRRKVRSVGQALRRIPFGRMSKGNSFLDARWTDRAHR